MRQLTLDQWKLLQDCIGIAAKARGQRAGYESQPCVGSVHDKLREVQELLQSLAAVEEVVLDNIRALEPAAQPVDDEPPPF